MTIELYIRVVPLLEYVHFSGENVCSQALMLEDKVWFTVSVLDNTCQKGLNEVEISMGQSNSATPSSSNHVYSPTLCSGAQLFSNRKGFSHKG